MIVVDDYRARHAQHFVLQQMIPLPPQIGGLIISRKMLVIDWRDGILGNAAPPAGIIQDADAIASATAAANR